MSMDFEEIAELRGQEIKRLHRCCREYDQELAVLRDKLVVSAAQVPCAYCAAQPIAEIPVEAYAVAGWLLAHEDAHAEVAPHGELVIYGRNRIPLCKIQIQNCPQCGRTLGAAPMEMKKFSVKGCVERELNGERWIERPAEGEEADFWGVYAIDHEGHDIHVADFNNKSDAEFFARCKEAANA